MSDLLQAHSDVTRSLLRQQQETNKVMRDIAVPTTSIAKTVDKYDPADSSVRSLSLVQERIYSAVSSGRFETNPSEATKTTPDSKNDYSPESVSRRVLGFVGNYMEKLVAQGADTERLQNVFAQAKSAVSKGIEDATEKLSALNWLNQGVQNDIETTENMIFKGFDVLEERFFAGEASIVDSNSVATTAVAALDQTQYQRAHSTSVQINTLEGDKITLNLSSLKAVTQAESNMMTTNGDSAMTEYRRFSQVQSEFRFDYAVEGNLNESEREAIDQLVQGLGQVADQFFSGDAQAALEQGLKMGYDTSQLAGFAMALHYSESYQRSQAVLGYGQSGAMGAMQPSQSIIQPLREYNEKLSDISQKMSAQFENMQQVVSETMEAILAMRAELAEKHQKIAQIFEFSTILTENALATKSDSNPPTLSKSIDRALS